MIHFLFLHTLIPFLLGNGNVVFIVLDYYHMVENVNNFAKYIHPDNEIKAKGWAKQVVKKTESGHVNEVLKELPDLKEVKLPTNVSVQHLGRVLHTCSISSGRHLLSQQRHEFFRSLP